MWKVHGHQTKEKEEMKVIDCTIQWCNAGVHSIITRTHLSCHDETLLDLPFFHTCYICLMMWTSYQWWTGPTRELIRHWCIRMCIVFEGGPDELEPMDRWSRMFVDDVGLILHWTLSIRWEFSSIANRNLPLAVSMKVAFLAPEPSMGWTMNEVCLEFPTGAWKAWWDSLV